jgi:hypothetical protein
VLGIFGQDLNRQPLGAIRDPDGLAIACVDAVCLERPGGRASERCPLGAPAGVSRGDMITRPDPTSHPCTNR